MHVFWSWFTGSNRISLAIQGAHEASVFALCMLRNGTLVSGGKDRKLISWDENYQKIQTVEVRHLHRYHFAICSMHLYSSTDQAGSLNLPAILNVTFRCLSYMALFGLWLKDGEKRFLLALPKTMSCKAVWTESSYPSPR